MVARFLFTRCEESQTRMLVSSIRSLVTFHSIKYEVNNVISNVPK